MALKNSWKWLVALGAVFVPVTANGTLTIPYQFSTKVEPTQLNANFSAVKSFADGLETRTNGLQTTKADKPPTGTAFARTKSGKVAYARANCSSGTCSVPKSYAPGGAVTVTRVSVGGYFVSLPGTTLDTAPVFVHAFGLNCRFNGRRGTAELQVSCSNQYAAAADADFSVVVME
jgi:hypothetical protein